MIAGLIGGMQKNKEDEGVVGSKTGWVLVGVYGGEELSVAMEVGKKKKTEPKILLGRYHAKSENAWIRALCEELHIYTPVLELLL